MCLVIFVTQTRWYDFFDESLHVMERLRKRQSLLVSPIRGRESCLEWEGNALLIAEVCIIRIEHPIVY